jgi:hypothetical protein
VRTAKCVCKVCGREFGSVEAFDAHRIGRYVQGLPAGKQPRKCKVVKREK